MGFSAGKMQDGGKLNGPSHAEGGIPIEVEGGEYIVNKSDTTKFLPILEDINYNSGEMWQHFVNATSILNTNLKDHSANQPRRAVSEFERVANCELPLRVWPF